MKKTKILISTTSFGKIDKKPINILKEKGLELIFNPYGRQLSSSEVIRLAKDVKGIIAGTEKLDAKTLSKLNNVKVISRCGAGMDNVDIKMAKKMHISVFNTPDGPTDAVAELTICLMLCLLRKVSVMDRQIRKGKWNKMMGNLLKGKKVGIIGLGRIGRRVAELLHGFGADLHFSDPKVKSSKLAKKCSLAKLLQKVDIITIHIPYSKNNEYLINKNRIALMKSNSIIINCSRGKIVDEKSLFMALKNNKISGAALDTFEKEPYKGPLRKLDNVILTPHIGSYAQESRVNMEKEASLNLLKGLKNA